MSRIRHPLAALAGVVGLTLPWVVLASGGFVRTLPITGVILTSGIAVIGAAFVLT